MKSAEGIGLSKRAFAVAWSLREDSALKTAGFSPDDLAREAQGLLERFPNTEVNQDEMRRFRSGLYRPFLGLAKDDRSRIVDVVVATLLAG